MSRRRAIRLLNIYMPCILATSRMICGSAPDIPFLLVPNNKISLLVSLARVSYTCNVQPRCVRAKRRRRQDESSESHATALACPLIGIDGCGCPTPKSMWIGNNFYEASITLIRFDFFPRRLFISARWQSIFLFRLCFDSVMSGARNEFWLIELLMCSSFSFQLVSPIVHGWIVIVLLRLWNNNK